MKALWETFTAYVKGDSDSTRPSCDLSNSVKMKYYMFSIFSVINLIL